jgi:thiamine kinase-like enzyme
MNQYVFLTNYLSVNKKFPKIAVPFLLFKSKPFMPKNPFKRIKTIYYILLSSKRIHNEISLPVKGEIALTVGDSNYKIINIKDNTISTVFNQNNEKMIYKCLHYSNSSRVYEEIINVDQKNRIIKGVFYNGHHPNLIETNLKLNGMVCDLLFDLLTKSDIKKVREKDYGKTLYVESLDILKRNSFRITEEQFNYVKEFVLNKYAEITKKDLNGIIHLTLSHGDIKEDNLIEINHKLFLIDWEFCDFRLPGFDILHFMSRYPNFDATIYEKLVGKLKNHLKSVESFGNDVEKYFHQSSENFLDIFFLEAIKLRLTKFETRKFAEDFSNYVVNYIKMLEAK